MALRALAGYGIAHSLYNGDGETALTYATRRGAREAVSTILAMGVPPDLPNRAGEYPLDLAFSSGDTAVLNTLSEAAPLQRCDERGNNALQRTFLNYSADNMLRISRAKYDHLNRGRESGSSRVFNFQNDDGDTILHLLSQREVPGIAGNYLIMLLLLGADRNVQNSSGETALHASIDAGDPDLTVELLSSDEELREQLRRSADIQYLVAGRAIDPIALDPNVQDVQGRTILMALLASRMAHNPRILELVLRYKPDLDRLDNEGNSALAYAIRHGIATAASELIKHGANCKAEGLCNERSRS